MPGVCARAGGRDVEVSIWSVHKLLSAVEISIHNRMRPSIYCNSISHLESSGFLVSGWTPVALGSNITVKDPLEVCHSVYLIYREKQNNKSNNRSINLFLALQIITINETSNNMYKGIDFLVTEKVKGHTFLACLLSFLEKLGGEARIGNRLLQRRLFRILKFI